jgi:hypothetical protein
MVLRGVNFGVQYRLGLPANHSASVGGRQCDSLAWQSDAVVSCVPPRGLAVGPHNVTIVVGGAGSAPFLVHATCPSGSYGRVGEVCSACPSYATCSGGTADPAAARGFYPTGRLTFVACVPVEACAGGLSYDAITSGGGSSGAPDGCSTFYRGPACAQCSSGAHRVKGRCVACPSTEWLLYLVFAGACTVLGLAVVYIRKKRISLAGLSVGVVSAGPAGTWGLVFSPMLADLAKMLPRRRRQSSGVCI